MTSESPPSPSPPRAHIVYTPIVSAFLHKTITEYQVKMLHISRNTQITPLLFPKLNNKKKKKSISLPSNSFTVPNGSVFYGLKEVYVREAYSSIILLILKRDALAHLTTFFFPSSFCWSQGICVFIRMAGIVQWVSRRCLNQQLPFFFALLPFLRALECCWRQCVFICINSVMFLSSFLFVW